MDLKMHFVDHIYNIQKRRC